MVDQTQLVDLVGVIKELSNQMSPKVVQAMGKAAMLDAQGDLVFGSVFAFIGLLFIAEPVVVMYWLSKKDKSAVSFLAGDVLWGLLIGAVFLAVSLPYLLNPLLIASASDPDLALARMVFSKAF